MDLFPIRYLFLAFGLASAVGVMTTEARAGTPNVGILTANPINATSARLWGRVLSDGGSSIVERRFDWGRAGTWTDWTANVITSGSDFYYDLGGLSPGTVYQFRAWAKNSSGSGFGMSGAGYFTTDCTYSLGASSADFPSNGGNEIG